jgi:hypothetical protein
MKTKSIKQVLCSENIGQLRKLSLIYYKIYLLSPTNSYLNTQTCSLLLASYSSSIQSECKPKQIVERRQGLN